MFATGDQGRRPARARSGATARSGGFRPLVGPIAVVAILAAVLGAPPSMVRAVASPSARVAPAGPLAIDALHAADLTRPRIVMGAGDLALVQGRVTREPYASLLRDLQDRADAAPAANAADQATCVQTANKDREALKNRAALDLSFLYLIDRVYDHGTNTVVQPSPAARAALGDRARDYLRFMCTESLSLIHI